MTTITTSAHHGQMIDPYCDLKGKVYQDYNCALNQTDIKTNKNKFYIMQIIERGSDNYSLFIRYGRLGEVGRLSYDDQLLTNCVAKFEKQFQNKTKNKWINRQNFIQYPGKYYLCKLDSQTSQKSQGSSEDGQSDMIGGTVCRLEDRVQAFLNLVSDENLMVETLMELKIDTKKMPLGKISVSQINQARQILLQIQQNLVSGVSGDSITNQSSDFYTLIPYACGRRKPPVIDDQGHVNRYLDMVEELRNLEVAHTVVTNNTGGQLHPLDRIYGQLNTQIRPLDRSEEMWSLIENYVTGTHAPTHGFQAKLLDIYEIERSGEQNRFDAYCQREGVQQKMLLWHGTRLTNYLSILKSGLILHPEKVKGVVISGKMFSQGIYFASSFSKSFNYTGWRSSGGQGVACLFLAEIAVGKQDKRTSCDYYITEESTRTQGYHSVWGQGETTFSQIVEKNGLRIPQGPLTKSDIQSDLLYDEFIVYNHDQVRLKYIVQVQGGC